MRAAWPNWVSTSRTRRGSGRRPWSGAQNSASGTSSDGSRREPSSHSSRQASGEPPGASTSRMQITSSTSREPRWIRSRQRRQWLQIGSVTGSARRSWPLQEDGSGSAWMRTEASTGASADRGNRVPRTARCRCVSRKWRTRPRGSRIRTRPSASSGWSRQSVRQTPGIARANGSTISASMVSDHSQPTENSARGAADFLRRPLRAGAGNGSAWIEGRYSCPRSACPRRTARRRQ